MNKAARCDRVDFPSRQYCLGSGLSALLSQMEHFKELYAQTRYGRQTAVDRKPWGFYLF